MSFDHRPDRPVPPRDNRRPGHRRPAPWLRETRVERIPARPQRDSAWDSQQANAWDSWPDDEAWSSDSHEAAEPRAEGRERSGAGAGGARSSHAKPTAGMRKALMMSGVLGGAMVLAIALVAVMVLRSGGSPSKPSQAAGFTSTTGASSSPTASPSAKASTSAKPKKTVKPSASPKASKTAKAHSASTHASAPAASSALAVPAGWKLTFDPGFSGSTLSSTWSTCYDWATSVSAGCTNNPSTEKEWYLPSQVQVSGGVLNLTAKQETTQGQSSSGAAQTYACRSGMVSSKPGFNFTYGLIQVTAKLPYGPGLWPALWLAATNDQWPPELDIMEHWYSDQDYKIYDHTVGTSYIGGPVPTPVNLSTGFHTYSLMWTKDRVTWYLDGVQKFTTTDHVPQQSMYFIANVADRIPDGETSTSIAPGDCTGTMQIQSVKVWQP
jgi:beta-glucanase (GH16 family)